MMAALLFVLTATVVLLPMLPALIEWRWPSDVVPLHIDTEDALDPPFLARTFAARLRTAVADGQQRLGRSLLALAPPGAVWTFIERERRSGLSRRVWHAGGDIQLPAGMTFLAEVAAGRHLRTAPREVYRALSAGQQLHLAAGSTVLRWAHGAQVEVHSGCMLAGRISADAQIKLLGAANFTLLHAPAVCFGIDPVRAAARLAPPLAVASAGLPPPVQWNAVAGRGTCEAALALRAGTAWRGDLVCQSDLTLGPRCSAAGSLKAHGHLLAGAGCHIAGNLVTVGRIELGAACAVLGSVISETEIVLGAGCVIGAPGRLATVAAPRILVAPDVVVHGTVWAGKVGRTHAPGGADEALSLPGDLLDGLASGPNSGPGSDAGGDSANGLGSRPGKGPGQRPGGGLGAGPAADDDSGFADWAETRLDPRPAAAPVTA